MFRSYPTKDNEPYKLGLQELDSEVFLIQAGQKKVSCSRCEKNLGVEDRIFALVRLIEVQNEQATFEVLCETCSKERAVP